MKMETLDPNPIGTPGEIVSPGSGAAGDEPLGETGLRRRLGALGLTPRQQDVAALVVRGLPNKIIAARLAISEHTVKDHLKGIFGHLRLRRRSALTARVFGLEPA